MANKQKEKLEKLLRFVEKHRSGRCNDFVCSDCLNEIKKTVQKMIAEG